MREDPSAFRSPIAQVCQVRHEIRRQVHGSSAVAGFYVAKPAMIMKEL